MNELTQAALEIIAKMRPYPDGRTIYPRYTKGEPVKRYIDRITRTRDGGLQIDGRAGTQHYLYYSIRDAERDYNRRARERTA